MGLLVLGSGCGAENRLGRVRLSGSVQLDGLPLDEGSISFEPYEHVGVASGGVIKGGRYEVAAAQGVPPGEYLVRIYAPVSAPGTAAEEQPVSVPGPTAAASGPSQPPPGTERIPAAYNTRSEQRITVTAEGPNAFDFDIKTDQKLR